MRSPWKQLLAVVIFFIAPVLQAQTPRSFSYQGLLITNGEPVSGEHSITVTIYDGPDATSGIYSEEHVTTLSHGVFNIILGGEHPIPSYLKFDKQYWIGTRIDGGAELSPRTALTSLPYSLHAEEAASLAKGAKGAVTSLNGSSGDIQFKGENGTTVTTIGNTITISAPGSSIGTAAPQATFVNQVTGTANQITASPTTGNVVLSLPQNIATTSAVTFGGATLNGATTIAGTTNINTASTSATSIGNSGTMNLKGGTINIQGAGGGTPNINIGENTFVDDITIDGGSVNINSSNSGSNTGDINIGSTANSGDVTIESSTSAGTITLHALNLTLNTPAAGTIKMNALNRGLLHSDNSGVITSTAVDLTSNDVTGSLDETKGGTAQTAYTKGDLLYASAANTLARRAIGSAGQVLSVSGGLPVWTSLSGLGVTSIGGTANQVLVNGGTADQTGDVTLSLPQSIGTSSSPTFNGMTLSGLGTGVVHSNAGTLNSSLITNTDVANNANIAYSKLNLANSIDNGDIAAAAAIAYSKLDLNNSITSADIVNGTITNTDINAGAAIADTKLATITSAGKVSNSATTATSNNTANAIVARNAAGNFTANVVTADLVGDVTGNVTGNVSGTSSNVTGTVTETHGGTSLTAYTKGDILYASGTNTLARRAIGPLGTVLSVSNTGVPVWTALSGVGVTSLTGTVNQVFVNGDLNPHTGGLTISLPQNIDVTASPTFAGLTLSSFGTGIVHSTAGVLSSALIVDGDVSASAAIGYSKLNLAGSVTNNDIAATAAITDNKLATIATAGKVANSATTATASAAANTIVLRDASGNFAAGTITADLNGNAATATSATTAGSAASFTGSLAGDVTGTQGATVVSSVGGQSAATIASGAVAAAGATNTNTAGTIVKRDGSGNFSAGTITATLNGTASSATTAGNFTGSLSGDVTGTQSATVVSAVGGQTAATVATGAIAANAATDANTASTIVKRDASGNFSAGTITATLNGTASSATTATTATTAANFTGSLSGNVTGTQNATVVASVGGQSAAAVASGVIAANAATNLNTVSTIVKRDASGNFSAGTITAALNGNATSATTATNFSGSLSGDVSGPQAATVVSVVGGQSASTIASATSTVNAATALNNMNTLVKRDGSGNFSAGTITANLTGNISGTSSNVTGTVTEAHGGTNQTSYTKGDILYSSATNLLSKLPIGTNGSVLTVSGSGVPSWQSLPVSAPVGASYVVISNDATLSTERALHVGTGLSLADGGANGNVTLANTGVISTIAGSGISLNAATGTVTITNTGVLSATAGSGISLSGSAGNISINNTGLLSAVAGSGISIANNSGNLTIDNSGVLSLTGTANQIAVSQSTGDITLSLPQNIDNGASPTFTGLTLTGLPSSSTSTDIVVSNGGSLETRSLASLAGSYWTLGGNSSPSSNVFGTTTPDDINIITNGSNAVIIGQNGALNIVQPTTSTTGLQIAGFTELHNTGFANTFLGLLSGYQIASGQYNVGVGDYTLLNVSSGSNNVALGFQSLQGIQDASANVAVGTGALATNISGNGNTAVGYAALQNSLSNNNTAVGNTALMLSSDGSTENNAVGNASLANNTTGSYNTAVGSYTLSANTTEQYNTAVGYNAGQVHTNGNNNTFIGAYADADPGVMYSTAIGTGAYAIESFSVVIGNNVNVGIGDNNPLSLLSVGEGSPFQVDNNGDLTMIKNIPYVWPTANASGVLVNDGSGNLSWGVPMWSLGGNSGTSAGSQFLGTTDDQPFEIHVYDGDAASQGSKRVLRIEPNASSANLIGGYQDNSVTNSAVGATITGGGVSGSANTVSADYATVNGGANNTAAGSYSSAMGSSSNATQYGQASHASGSFATAGDAQTSVFVERGTTSSQTAVNLTLDGGSTEIVVPSGTTYAFHIILAARDANGNSATYVIDGNAAEVSGSLNVTSATSTTLTNGFTTGSVSVGSNGTTLHITVQDSGGSVDVRWVARIETSEVQF